jgi:hypothetical protein
MQWESGAGDEWQAPMTCLVCQAVFLKLTSFDVCSLIPELDEVDMRIGEKWLCSNPNCGTEIVVIKSSRLGATEKPVCGCGNVLQRPFGKPAVGTLPVGISQSSSEIALGKQSSRS